MAIVRIVNAAQAAEGAEPLDVALIVVTLVGGLALFLLGLDRMTYSLKLVAGHRMRSVLGRLTHNRFAGALTGAGVTAVIQSSSVTTVMVVGFITSGLLTVPQAVGVIMGANVGTTVTAQIIAFEATRYALAIVAAGFVLSFFPKRDDLRAYGNLLVGLGLVFYGMVVMGDAVEPLQTSEWFIDFLGRMDAPLLGIAAGIVFTALIQASAATAGVVIVLAGRGLLSLEAGIAIIMGANVGTAVTALLAAIGKPRAATRAAVIHTLYNLAGVVLWLPFLPQLADLVTRIGGSPAREVANAHTIFNVANLVVFIGFTTQIARLSERLVPDRPAESEALVRAKYLNSELLHTPTLALDRARLELLRMAHRVRTMLTDVHPAILDGSGVDILAVEHQDDEVDALHGQVVAYLGKISKTQLSEASTEELVGLLSATNDLEAIGDIIETNMVQLGLTRIEHDLVISTHTRRVLADFHDTVLEAFDLAVEALTDKHQEAARRVVEMKRTVNRLEADAQAHEAQRLVAPEPRRVDTYRFEVDVISNLKRVFYFSRRIARAAIPPGERTGV